MAGHASIEPLNAENYDTWTLHMRAILIKNDLWGYAGGLIARPAAGSETENQWLYK